jgi:hypothetical protein
MQNSEAKEQRFAKPAIVADPPLVDDETRTDQSPASNGDLSHAEPA